MSVGVLTEQQRLIVIKMIKSIRHQRGNAGTKRAILVSFIEGETEE